MALVQADFAQMRGCCAEHGGEVLNTMGDGMLLCFPSALQAVVCALEIQKAFGRRSETKPAEESLEHRIGIHLGDIVRENGGVAGDGVNIAARVQTKARPGTICLSQSVLDAVKGKIPMQVESLGPQALKNIAEPITLHLVSLAGVGRPAAAGPKFRARWLVGAGVVAGAVLAGAVWPRMAKVVPSPAASRPAPGNEAASLVTQAHGLVNSFNGTRDRAALAESLARKATELEPASAETWAALGYVNFYYYLRGWDATPERLEAARSNANRALSLVPEQSEALLTLAHVLSTHGADDAQAEALFRRAQLGDSRDNRIRRGLGGLLARTQRLPEAIALLQEALKIDPGDSLTHYNFAALSVTTWDFPSAMKSVDAALAAHSFGSGWMLKAILCANWKGDLPGMRRALDRLTPAERTEDRAVYLLMWCALMERAPARVIEAAQLMPRDYVDDLFFRGPKGWLTGRAQALLGRENLAQLDYAAAEVAVRARMARAASSQQDKICLAIALALQGRVAEARQEIAPVESAAREQSPVVQARWLAMFYAVLGDGEHTVFYLRKIDDQQGAFTPVTPPLLRIDPWWDKLRGQPEFEALLQDPAYCPALR